MVGIALLAIEAGRVAYTLCLKSTKAYIELGGVFRRRSLSELPLDHP